MGIVHDMFNSVTMTLSTKTKDSHKPPMREVIESIDSKKLTVVVSAYLIDPISHVINLKC